MAVCQIDYSQIGRYAKWLALGLVGLEIFMIFRFSGMSGSVNGVRVWILFGGLGRLDLRLAMLLYVPLYAAILYTYRDGGYKEVGKSLAWMTVPFVTTMYMSSVVTAATLFISCGILFTAAVCWKWYRVSAEFVLGGFYFVTLTACAILFGYILYEAPAYQAARLGSFFRMEDVSYTVQTARTLLAGSRWIGRADGQDVGEILSRAGGGLVEGDYMLTELGGYYGTAFAVILVAVIAFLFLHLLKACLRQKNQLGRMMGMGCVVVLLIALASYVLVNMGKMSAAGYWCPFVTYGGGGMFLTSVLLGILLSVYRYGPALGRSAG